jgi:hypothetical protein
MVRVACGQEECSRGPTLNLFIYCAQLELGSSRTGASACSQHAERRSHLRLAACTSQRWRLERQRSQPLAAGAPGISARMRVAAGRHSRASNRLDATGVQTAARKSKLEMSEGQSSLELPPPANSDNSSCCRLARRLTFRLPWSLQSFMMEARAPDCDPEAPCTRGNCAIHPVQDFQILVANRYSIDRKIGKGSFGLVYTGMYSRPALSRLSARSVVKHDVHTADLDTQGPTSSLATMLRSSLPTFETDTRPSRPRSTCMTLSPVGRESRGRIGLGGSASSTSLS